MLKTIQATSNAEQYPFLNLRVPVYAFNFDRVRLCLKYLFLHTITELTKTKNKQIFFVQVTQVTR